MARRQSMRRFTIGVGLVALFACGGSEKGGADKAADGGGAGGDASSEADAGSGGSDGGANAGEGGAADSGDANTQVPRWYESKAPLDLELSGAFGDAFRAAFAGMPDGIVPPDRKKTPFAGDLSYVFASDKAHEAKVVLSVRGESSLQECAFPKLKLAFDKRVKDEDDTFFDTSKIKIGTHCGEEETTNGNIGRLRNEKAAWREEVAYQLARALGITIMQTRPASIVYSDTSTELGFESPLTRKAFLLEHVDELARRLGAKAAQDPTSCGDNPAARPDHQSVLRIKMFHAMLGNWDFALGPAAADGCGDLRNTEVLTHADGSLTLVPADFDLSAFVVAEVRNPDTSQLEPVTLDRAKASARTYLASAVEGESNQAVDAIKAELVAKKDILSDVIADSLMDDAGKASGQLLLDGFFAVLSE